MDADFREKRRKRVCTDDRQKRWSMNSQRLEEIVAELMRPIGDLRHSFDTDLSALLEEYLTEAGLHALEAEESDEDGSGGGGDFIVPNFAELALLLQQSACIYGRKVDCLYQHVLSVSDSLLNSTLEISNPNETLVEEEVTEGLRRRRQSTSTGEFTAIELTSSAASLRGEGAVARAPPVLPRPCLELEPRPLPPHALQLQDYSGEPVGLLHDFHVAWRLQEGQLVEELEMTGTSGSELRVRAIPLLELQACISAAAAACPPPPTPPPLTPPPPSPVNEDMPPPATPLQKKDRKRRSDTSIDLLATPVKFKLTEEGVSLLLSQSLFNGEFPWRTRVMTSRVGRVRALRAALQRRKDSVSQVFRGFPDYCTTVFHGWPLSEGQAAVEAARLAAERRHDDSDDDGFFEQSSESDVSRLSDIPPDQIESVAVSESEHMSWARLAAARSERGARTLDVRALGARLLGALPPPPEDSPINTVLNKAGAKEDDVSHLFLATLFLANSGNVEIIPGPALSLGTCRVRLRDTDTTRLRPDTIQLDDEITAGHSESNVGHNESTVGHPSDEPNAGHPP